MLMTPWLMLVALIVPPAAAAGQAAQAAPMVLATVQISESVLANGKPLPVGRYQVRLTDERLSPNPGQSPQAAQWVEFVAEGSVVAREVAEVIRDDDRPDVGASAQHAVEGVRVQRLLGGEYLRIAVTRPGVRYLIYLPIVGAAGPAPPVGPPAESSR
jgi:hypothetical protein